MKILTNPQGSDAWHQDRRGRFTGTKLKDAYSEEGKTATCARLLDEGKTVEEVAEITKASKATITKASNALSKYGAGAYAQKHKLGFYQLVAEGMGMFDADDDSSDRQRGLMYEDEAREFFAKTYGLKIRHEDVGLCVSDEHDGISYSSDGLIENDTGVYTEDIEIKCPSAARHTQTIDLNEIPEEYEKQIVQGFIVNPDLKKRYYVSYDPRITTRPMHVIEAHRKDYEPQIEEYKRFQIHTLKQVKDLVNKLSF